MMIDSGISLLALTMAANATEGARMKAAICKQYGPPEVLHVENVERPVPKDDEVLIKIHASSVNSSDWFIRSGNPPGPLYERILLRLLIGLTRPRKRILGDWCPTPVCSKFSLQTRSGNEIEPAGPVDGRPAKCKKRLALQSFLTGVGRRSGRFNHAAAVRLRCYFENLWGWAPVT
jgi:hypothetical protein